MVLQRIQSLYLLIAVVLMVIFTTVIPVGNIADAPIKVYNIPGLLIVSALTTVLILIDIFLFGNLKLQMRVCRINMYLAASVEVVLALCYSMLHEINFTVMGLVLLTAFPVVVFVFLWLALSGMKRDHKTLTDYDHFR